MRETLEELMRRPARLTEELRRARADAGEALERCLSVTGNTTGAPRGPFHSGARDGAWADYAAFTAEVDRLLRSLNDAEGELDAFLARVRAIQGFRDYCVLHRRYRLGQPWAQVRTDLQATFGRPLTLRTVHNWHRAALDQARALWESAA